MDKGKAIQCIGLNHAEVKRAARLFENKKVDEEDLFIIEGTWAYEKLMRAGTTVKTALFCPQLLKNEYEHFMVERLTGLAENSYQISEKVCRKISDRDDPDGCFIIGRLQKHSLEDIKIRENDIVIVLDGLEKPGNIGTIIRSADAAGVSAVIVCNQKVKLTHHRLIKASMGSSLLLTVAAAEIGEVIKWLEANKFRILLTDLKAERTCYEADYSGRIAIVGGNEIRGVSEEWYGHQCEGIIIPMFGGADSLNVGFATTLVAYEAAVRQRHMVER